MHVQVFAHSHTHAPIYSWLDAANEAGGELGMTSPYGYGLLLLVSVSSCGPNVPSSSARGAGAAAVRSEPNVEPPAVPAPTEALEPDACPIAPLRLVVNAFPPVTQTRTTFIALELGGDVMVVPLGLRGRLDPNGCLTLGNAVKVDASSAVELWTPYERFEIDHGRIQLPGERSLQIADDGSVVTLERSGETETRDLITIEGYAPGAECAARALVVAFLGLMPTVVAPDGSSRRLEPPPGSPCFSPPTDGVHSRPWRRSNRQRATRGSPIHSRHEDP